MNIPKSRMLNNSATATEAKGRLTDQPMENIEMQQVAQIINNELSTEAAEGLTKNKWNQVLQPTSTCA